MENQKALKKVSDKDLRKGLPAFPRDYVLMEL